MFGSDYQTADYYFQELRSRRIVATQLTRKADDDYPATIISRTFSVYDFDDLADIKQINEKPPFWAGIIPGDESTYTNPITDPVDYHYIVRIKYNINEYSGYLMYAQPVENLEELKKKGLITADFIDPDDVNLYKAWFNRQIDLYAYDYYVPIRTGAEFTWIVEKITVDVKVPQFSSLDKTGGYSTYSETTFEETLAAKVEEYEDKGYEVEVVDNSDDSIYFATVIATRHVYNLGEVDLDRYDLTANYAVFKIRNNGMTGVAIKFTIQNCKVWLSVDGVKFSEAVNPSQRVSKSLTTLTITVEKLKLYKYIIIQPSLNIILESIPNKFPPFKFLPAPNQGFTFKAEYIGRHYLHFKEDVIDVSTDTNLIKSIGVVDLNDPKPNGIALHPYEFIDESDANYWDGQISFT